ncbi:MAG: hypothetical protein WBD47_00010 [Phormidesmis sp.]
MIGGIFETIGKTLGIGKEKYFLELDDAAEESLENLKASASKAAKSAVETAKDASSDVIGAVQSVTDDATDKAEAVAASGKQKAKKVATEVEESAESAGKTAKEAAKNTKKAAKTAAKKAPGEKSDGKAKTAPADKQPAAPKVVSAEDLIVDAIAATSKKADGSGQAEEAHSFASDFLMPQANRGRRRPGPSLSGFKGMAREVNPRLKG